MGLFSYCKLNGDQHVPLKLLLADEDKGWSEKLSKYLEENSYKVDLVHNGRSAQLSVYNNQYFAVIINPSIKKPSYKVWNCL